MQPCFRFGIGSSCSVSRTFVRPRSKTQTCGRRILEDPVVSTRRPETKRQVQDWGVMLTLAALAIALAIYIAFLEADCGCRYLGTCVSLSILPPRRMRRAVTAPERFTLRIAG